MQNLSQDQKLDILEAVQKELPKQLEISSRQDDQVRLNKFEAELRFH